jgi:hypothetical protein
VGEATGVTAAWGYAAWVVLAVITLALWALSYARWGRRLAVRPGAALARVASDPWLRVPLLLGWAWLGWHLFAR